MSTTNLGGESKQEDEAEGFNCYFDSIVSSLRFGPPSASKAAKSDKGEEVAQGITLIDVGSILDAEVELSQNRLITVHKPLTLSAPGQQMFRIGDEVFVPDPSAAQRRVYGIVMEVRVTSIPSPFSLH